jgi:hypothetical protein
LRVDRRRFALGGDSAGGNLAIVTALALHIAVPGLIHGFLTLGKLFPEVAATGGRIGLQLRLVFAGERA